MKPVTVRLYGFLPVLLVFLGCSMGPDAGPPSSAGPTSASEAADNRTDPTVARFPRESRSLELSANWTPPAPTRTTPAHRSARVEPSPVSGFPTRGTGQEPTDAEVGAVTIFAEPLRPLPGVSSKEETRALANALRDAERPGEDGIPKLRRFVEAYPRSRWAPGLHLNLGALSYQAGYFQRALSHFRAAWDLAKDGRDLVAEQTANMALAQYAMMNARVGRMAELDGIFAQARERTFTGDARVKMQGAVDGHWMMRNRPGVAFRCGPYAILNVGQQLKPEIAKTAPAFLARTQSTPTGFSISQVRTMATELGLRMQIAKREPGAEVLLPSVVHWKVGHFGAILREVDGKYLLKDPTFGNDTWLTRDALDEEASGYFLVPAGPLPRGWTRATDTEASVVYGKGHSGNIVADDTSDDDQKTGDGGCDAGADLAMATYQFHTLATSLHIRDTPVGYAAAVGPDVRVRVAYNQREADQPNTMLFTNFGPRFVSNWVSYLVDDTTNTSADVKLRKRGGGGEVHSSFNPATSTYARQPKTGAVVFRLTPNTYKKVYPDGRTEHYERFIGTSGAQRRVFLTRVQDPQSRTVTIEYDTDPLYPARIHRIVDATGLQTVFEYTYAGEPYLVTGIEDPFGRRATFTYAPVGGSVHLQSITDTIGIISSFDYGDGGIVAMTTPYGTTKFGLSPLFVDGGQGGYNVIRYVEATDPLGQKERLEYNTNGGLSGLLETPWPDSNLVSYVTWDNDDRNSFYWDKLAMKLAPGDYLKAHRYHWIQPHNADVTTSILESELPPLEGRIFYNYPGQAAQQPYIQGTLASPSVVARVVKDAAGTPHTQATKHEYNAQGNRTKTTDPLGRQTLLEYAANGIDVIARKQRTGGTVAAPVWTDLSTVAYGAGAPEHLPSSTTDGAGQTTTYTYTALGQVASITNPKAELTTFIYETNPANAGYGRVVSITGDVPGGNRTFTYDGYGRVLTTTSADGETLTYDYDALDRVRTVTYPDGSFEQLEYEDHSLVASRDREGKWTRHLYNRLRERVVTQDPALRTTQSQWCRCGQLRRFVDGNGNVTEWQRDEAARVTKTFHAKGTSSETSETNAYDFSGRLVSTLDAMGRTVTYEHTLDDRVSKKNYSDPATPDVTYTYDALFPRLVSRQDGTGTTSFTYHPYGATLGAGQIALENGPLADDTRKHTYDELGRLKKLEIVDDATQAVVSYSEETTFDARGRAAAVMNNLGNTANAFAGQSNRPTTVTYPNGMQVLYDYFGATGDHLVKQIKNLSATPATISQFDYTYRPDRAIGTWTVDQGSGSSAWTFGYDASRQLTSAEQHAGATLLASQHYRYDNAGNRVQVGTDLPVGTAPKNYEVNPLNQLVSERDYGRTTFAGTVNEPATVKVNGQPAKVMSTAGVAPFRFEALVDLAVGANTVLVEATDGNNNVATKTYSVTTTGTSKTYEYDPAGNLRYEKLPGGTVVREMRWDQQNRLVRELHGTHESVYEYDGESRRTRIREVTAGAETKNETFVWCGSRICQKRAANGSTVIRSYFGNGFEGAGATTYLYARDHLGSVREVVGSDGVTVASRLSFDPWGKVSETGAGATSDFGYTGHHLDRSTGLGLTWYRGYDAGLGRWLSRDPIGLAGGINLYAYVNNDPANGLDPTGLAPLDVFLCLWNGGGWSKCWEQEGDRLEEGCRKNPTVCKAAGGIPGRGGPFSSDESAIRKACKEEGENALAECLRLNAFEFWPRWTCREVKRKTEKACLEKAGLSLLKENSFSLPCGPGISPTPVPVVP